MPCPDIVNGDCLPTSPRNMCFAAHHRGCAKADTGFDECGRADARERGKPFTGAAFSLRTLHFPADMQAIADFCRGVLSLYGLEQGARGEQWV